MQLDNAGIAFVKQNEGLIHTAYILSGEKYPTIGWGHYGKDVRVGQKITDAQADALFIKDSYEYTGGVSRDIHVKLNQNQFNALVDFAYNEGYGIGGLQDSTLAKLLNAGDYIGASKQFARWTASKSASNKRGLTARRERERVLFLKAPSTAQKASTPAVNNANTTAQQDAKKKADALIATNKVKAKQALDASNKAKAIQAQKVLDQAKLTKNKQAIDDAQTKLNNINKATKVQNSVPPKQKVIKSGFTIVGLLVTVIFFKYGFDL